VLRRGLPLLATIGIGVALIALARLVERPIYGSAPRPLTARVVRAFFVMALVWMGLPRRVSGRPTAAPGPLVCNHVSWLDIFVLGATQRVVFVSKADVRGWPGVGWLAALPGTMFIRRDRGDAAQQAADLAARVGRGERLVVFPEGTSSDGLRVLPFKSALFEAFFAAEDVADLWVQPVTISYQAPVGADPRVYGWWGDMDFASSALQILAMSRHGHAQVTYHPALRVRDYSGRKALARASEVQVRDALPPQPS